MVVIPVERFSPEHLQQPLDCDVFAHFNSTALQEVKTLYDGPLWMELDKVLRQRWPRSAGKCWFEGACPHGGSRRVCESCS